MTQQGIGMWMFSVQCWKTNTVISSVSDVIVVQLLAISLLAHLSILLTHEQQQRLMLSSGSV